MPIEGWLVDKFGPRPVIAGGAILAGIGWVINSYATSLPELYTAAVISGLGAGCVYGTCVGNALKWFPDKRGLAAGATAAGFGAGAALTVIPIANMIQNSGYQHTFFFFGILQGVCIFLIAMFMVKPVVPKGVVPSSRLVMSKVDYSVPQMLRSPVFWLTYALFVAVAAGGLMATAQIGPIAKDYGLAKTADGPAGLYLAAVDDDTGHRQPRQRLHPAAVRFSLRPHRSRKYHADRLRRRRTCLAGPDEIRATIRSSS